MIDRLGQCHYFQWSMIKSQPTPITKEGTSQSNHHWTFFTRLLLHTVTGSILNSYTDLPFFTGHFRLPVVSHFSSEIVERVKRERAWKSPHTGKGDTRRGERKMRDYRQSPSFWTNALLSQRETLIGSSMEILSTSVKNAPAAINTQHNHNYFTEQIIRAEHITAQNK